MYIILTIFILVSLILFYFSWSISLGFYLRSICHNRDAKGLISLTFDDGIDPILTPQVLEVLDKYGAKATFFIIGEKVSSYPHIVRMIVEKGHVIANHSMYHKGSFPMQRTKSIYDEIVACSKALEEVSGVQVKYFRPPFGVTNPTIGRAVRRSGLISVGWSIRSLDTMGQPVDVVESRVVKQIRGGDIILLHDNRECVVELTERILIYIYKNGYNAVSIDELILKK